MGAANAHHPRKEPPQEMTPRPRRVVIDTNLVLSALVFAQGRLTPLRHAWQGAHCQPLVSSVMVTELLRVLAYPKFKLSAADQQELVADYLPYCVTVRIPTRLPATPVCRARSMCLFCNLPSRAKRTVLSPAIRIC